MHRKPNKRRLRLEDVIRYRGVVEGLERSDREIEEELFDEDNALESKTTRDCCLFLQPSKRLESHPLFREEHPE